MTDGAERRFARDPGRDDAGDGWGALRDAEPDRPRHAGSPWLRSPAREAALGGEVYSVRELSRQVRFLLEAHFPVVAVRGEVTNLSRPQSGHIYFSLVD
ncbi:MAG TPA: exodeoxyribonuclease VII large subunit, partial [Planctomycetota bacterium]|nr:exodeoxyribonuclease VII large subunit [Planctomycetota bacterium]